ncbi:MAG: heme-binding protein [Parvularculaceae bacterium]|nr:heme-binding protein [Parvularculaceae bacterium]
MLAASISILALTAAAQAPVERLTDASTQTILATCFSYAEDNDVKVAITVVDDRLQLSGFRRMDGVRQGPADLSADKADYVARWGHPTRLLDDRVEEGKLGWALASKGVPITGGLPIYSKNGTLLGGVGVSGAPADVDEACAQAGINAAGLKSER